jgi:hypothetical protein
VKLKNIIFGLRRDLLLIPTDFFTKRNFEKLRLEATKSGLACSGVHFEGNRTYTTHMDVPTPSEQGLSCHKNQIHPRPLSNKRLKNIQHAVCTCNVASEGIFLQPIWYL